MDYLRYINTVPLTVATATAATGLFRESHHATTASRNCRESESAVSPTVRTVTMNMMHRDAWWTLDATSEIDSGNGNGIGKSNALTVTLSHARQQPMRFSVPHAVALSNLPHHTLSLTMYAMVTWTGLSTTSVSGLAGSAESLPSLSLLTIDTGYLDLQTPEVVWGAASHQMKQDKEDSANQVMLRQQRVDHTLVAQASEFVTNYTLRFQKQMTLTSLTSALPGTIGSGQAKLILRLRVPG